MEAGLLLETQLVDDKALVCVGTSRHVDPFHLGLPSTLLHMEDLSEAPVGDQLLCLCLTDQHNQHKLLSRS